jgi:hypothetical protein
VSKWGALAVAVLGAAVMLVSSAGAAEQSLAAQLSTRTGATLYLVQHGLDPAGFVIQRGSHNYAGPKCPGAGWNCTTSTRVLQISNHAGRSNQADCSGTSGVVTNTATDCEIVQSNNDGSNTATCEQESSDGNVSQRCVIFQTSTGGGQNTATVSQVIGATVTDGSAQNVHQYIGINQQNSTGDNVVNDGATINDQSVTQAISLAVSGGFSQSQDALQEISLTQNSTSGSNQAISLRQTLSENAQSQATDGQVIQQKQNTAATSPNTNAGVSQTTDSGQNSASLVQTHDLSELATGDSSGIVQAQGSSSGGINSFVDQHDNGDNGFSTFNGSQTEHQTENVDGGTIKGQTQIGPMWGDPQGSNSDDSFNLSQNSTQTNSSSGNGPTAGQHDEMYISCESSGGCSGGQGMDQNDHSQSDGCSASPCNKQIIDLATTDCGAAHCTTFPPPPNPPTKPQSNPTCVLNATIAGPPKQIKIEVQDANGVSNINVDAASNATVDVPSGYQGSSDPIIVTATKTHQDHGSFVKLTVTNANGDTTTCDPFIPAVHKKVKTKPAKVGHAKAKGLTLKLNAGHFAYGQANELTLSGSVPSGKAGEKVTLLTSTCGFKGDAALATLTTGPGGIFRYKLAPALGAAFSVRWNGITSAKKTVRVQPQVVIVRTGNGRVRVDVTTTNGLFLTGTKVSLQSFVGGHWKTVGTGNLAPNSPIDQITAVSSATIAGQGAKLRALVPATTCYSGAVTS